jgi:predicted transcriptional regulator
MASSRQTLLRRFIDRPPQLEGRLAISLEPVDERRAWLRVEGAEHRYDAKAAALTVPYPSGLKRLVASDPEVEVVLVEHASRGFDRAAVERSVNYLDLRGRGRLVGPGFVYVVPPTPPHLAPPGGDVDDQEERPSGSDSDPWLRQPAWKRSERRVSPFAPKASRTVRALLSEHERRWRLSELAALSRMNPGNVHRVLAALIDQGFVERDEDYYVVEDPGSLLEAWAEQGRRGSQIERLSIPVLHDLHAEVERLVDGLDGYAVVSGELAAELYAPYLSASQAIVHCVDEGAWNHDRLTGGLGSRPLRSKGHIVVDLVDAGVGEFSEVRDGLKLVSAQQLYFDLYRERSRAREAAEHVRQEVLRY